MNNPSITDWSCAMGASPKPWSQWEAWLLFVCLLRALNRILISDVKSTILQDPVNAANGTGYKAKTNSYTPVYHTGARSPVYHTGTRPPVYHTGTKISGLPYRHEPSRLPYRLIWQAIHVEQIVESGSSFLDSSRCTFFLNVSKMFSKPGIRDVLATLSRCIPLPKITLPLIYRITYRNI